jgi:L-arabinose isomerase
MCIYLDLKAVATVLVQWSVSDLARLLLAVSAQGEIHHCNNSFHQRLKLSNLRKSRRLRHNSYRKNKKRKVAVAKMTKRGVTMMI